MNPREILLDLGIETQALDALLPDITLLAKYKYDHYEMFTSGHRFFENLYPWLAQFEVAERQHALQFVRDHLVFISQREMQDLARYLFYDKMIPAILRHSIASEGLPKNALGEAFHRHFAHYLRRCLFVGLSDGAKIDYFRRHNIPISNEQVLPYYRSSAASYTAALRQEMGDPEATFQLVFLIDDFTGSGYTLGRQESSKPDVFGGILARVYDHHREIIDSAAHVYLCHYVATNDAVDHVASIVQRMPYYRGKFSHLLSLRLPAEMALLPETIERIDRDAPAVALAERILDMSSKYYDQRWEDDNTKRGGDIKFGFGRTGLPLVLFSNCPNNSLFLIWLNSDGSGGARPFRGLFRRIPRAGGRVLDVGHGREGRWA